MTLSNTNLNKRYFIETSFNRFKTFLFKIKVKPVEQFHGELQDELADLCER
jgi:hypothetical protein